VTSFHIADINQGGLPASWTFEPEGGHAKAPESQNTRGAEPTAHEEFQRQSNQLERHHRIGAEFVY
jgi:hypothetical protein